MVLIAGRGFAGGATPLILLSFYAALSCPATVFMDGLVYLRAEGTVLRVMLWATIITLAVAGSAIPFYAATAAAVALLTGSAVIVVSGAAAFRRVAGFGVSLARSARFVLVSASLTAIYLTLHLTAGYAPRGGWLMIPELLVLLAIYGSLAFGVTLLFRGGGHGLAGR
jgi:O-antigen/teichoic acid export membrane protein